MNEYIKKLLAGAAIIGGVVGVGLGVVWIIENCPILCCIVAASALCYFIGNEWFEDDL